MLLDLECRVCNSDIEVDTEALLESNGVIKCGNCRAKLDAKSSEQFASALQELVALLEPMRKKFSFAIIFDSDDVDLFEEHDEEEDADAWEEEPEIEEESFDEDE